MSEEQEKVIANLPEGLKDHVYIVGAWLWAEFQGKPSEEVRGKLKELGFRWNPKRGAWQNPCGVYRKRGQGDPRFKYGVVGIKEMEEVMA